MLRSKGLVAWTAVAALVAATVEFVVFPAAPASADPTPTTTTYTRDYFDGNDSVISCNGYPVNNPPYRYYIVPDNVTSVAMAIAGEQGSTGGSSSLHGGGVGGKGAKITAAIPVTPGEYLYFGTFGQGDSTEGPAIGGYATFVSRGNACFMDGGYDNLRLVALAAGGGAGGDGGGLGGGPGGTGGAAGAGGNDGGSNSNGDGGGGHPGTATAGGAGGTGAHFQIGRAGSVFAYSGLAGDALFGGVGGYDCNGNASGSVHVAGGGGGYGLYGGGGGGGACGGGGGGGGGGSSFVEAAATNVTQTLGTGDPFLSFTPLTYSYNTKTTLAPSTTTITNPDQSETFTATVKVPPQNNGFDPLVTPTGSVSFVAVRGSTSINLGTATLSGGTASVTSTLPQGRYSITASYSGGSSTNSTFSMTETPSASTAVGLSVWPYAPYRLNVARGGTIAAISWQQPASAGDVVTGFNIYQGTSSGHESTTPLNSSPLTGLNYTATGLTAGTTYYYKVVAIDSTDSSPQSAEVTAAPGAGLPAGLTVTVTPAPSAPNLYVADGDSGIHRYPFDSGVFTTLSGSGFVAASNGVAVDGYGNAYFTDTANKKIWERTASGSLVQVSTGAFTLTHPTAIASDSHGKLYVVDNNNVIGVPAGGGPAVVLSAALPLTAPKAVAVDAAGSVYIADGNQIVYVTAQGVRLTLGASLSSPSAVVVDPSGRLYVLDSGNNRIVSISPSSTQSVVATGLTGGAGLAVDTGGNIFVGLPGAAAIQEYPAGGGGAFTYATSVGSPIGLAVDEPTTNVIHGNPVSITVSVVTSPRGDNPGGTLNLNDGTDFRGQVTLPGTNPDTVGATFDTELEPGTHHIVASVWHFTSDSYIADASAPANIAVTGPPGAPSGLTAVAGDGKATLSWTAPTTNGGKPITSYDVWKVDAQGDDFSPVNPSPITATSYTVTGLTNGTPYYFAIKANNVNGFSLDSNDVTVVPKGTVTVTVTDNGPSLHNGDTLTYTATVTGTGPTPTGQIAWIVGGSTCATSTLDVSGRATCSITGVIPGSYTAFASYGGDGNFLAGSGTNARVSVARSDPTMSITANTPIAGSALVFVATVSGSVGAVTPVGAVTWTLTAPGGSHPACTGATGAVGLTNSARYSCTIASAVAGSYSASASFAQDSFYNSASATGTATVSGPTPALSWAAPGNIYYGDSLASTLDATSSAPGTFDYSENGTAITASTVLSVGDHTLVAAFTPTDPVNYSGGTISQTITISPKTITVTVGGTQSQGGSPTFTHSEVLPSGITLTGTVSCTTADVGQSLASLAPGQSHYLDGSSCGGLTLAGTHAESYVLFYSGSLFTVTQRAITITADNVSKTYGAADPTFTYTLTGLNPGDSMTALPTCSVPGNHRVVGTYTVTCSGAASAGYTFTYVGATLTINRAPLSITPPSPTTTYGTAATSISFPASIVGLTNGDTAASIGLGADCGTNAPKLRTSYLAGTYVVFCQSSSQGNYDITYVQGTLTVSPALLTATASNITFTYGGGVPAVTVGYSGLVNGDTTASVVSGSSCSAGVGSASTAGIYPTITSCTATTQSSNYLFVRLNGTATINKATLTVKADNKSKIYGAALPALTTTITGFVNGDTITAASGAADVTTVATAASHVGSYSITPSLGSLVATNYAFAFTAGTLTVTVGAVTVTAPSPSATYGVAASSISLAPGIAGLTNSDTAAGAGLGSVTCSTTAVVTSGGSYAAGIAPVVCTGPTSVSDYSVNYVPGTMTMAKAALIGTASDVHITYGVSPGAVTASYTGFVNGDTAGAVTGAATCSTTITSSTGAGAYSNASTCSGASAANYSFSYVKGSAVVGKAALTATASDGSSVYGASPPNISAAYTGFVNAEGSSAVTTPSTCSSNTSTTTGAGVYSSTSSCFGADAANYSFTYVKGTVTITEAALTATASDGLAVYGADPPAITVTYTGFVNGEDASVVTTPATCSSNTSATTAAGVYSNTSSCSGAGATNYSFGYAYGTVTIAKATLTATASDGTAVYGAAPPAITVNYAGFVDGDGVAAVTTAATCSSNTSNSTVAGTYAATSTCSGADAPNYSFSYLKGTVTITRATLTATASDGTAVYGANPPTIAVKYAGFVNGDDSSVVTTAATCSANTSSTSAAGTYGNTSSCSGAAAANYSFNYVKGTVTITKATLTATASDGTAVYGSDPPTIAVKYTGFVNGDGITAVSTAATCSGNTLAATGVGTYLNTSTCSGADAANYSFSYVNGAVTITKATLTATASDGTAVYGSDPPTITVKYTGFVNGDGVTAVTTAATCSANTLATTIVGTYVNTSTCAGADAPNYSFAYAKGTVTVTKATLTATASDGTSVYGTSPPTITVKYAGFVNGEDASVVTTAASCSANTTTATNAGFYLNKSACAGADATNYTFSYVNGTVTITQATPVLTSSAPASMTYGDADAAVSASTNSDQSITITVGPAAVCTLKVGKVHAVGTGQCSVSGSVAADTNYVAGSTSKSFSIATRPVTVTAVAPSVVFGQPVVVGATYSTESAGGVFVNGDTAATAFSTSPVCVSSKPTGTQPGTYLAAATCSGGVSANYTILSYVAGAVTITGIAPVVTTAPIAKTVASGSSVTFTATATGTPTPSARWQVSFDSGTTWTNISGATSTTFTIPTTVPAMDQSRYRAVFNNGILSGSPPSVDVATASALLTVTYAPVFVSNTNVGFTTGSANTFTIITAGEPKATLTEAGPLPVGVTFKAGAGAALGTATLSGTPTTASAGVYTLTITAKNSVGTTTQTITLVVVPPTVTPPVTAPLAANGYLLVFPQSVHNGQTVQVTLNGWAHYAPITYGWYTKSGQLKLSGSWGSADKSGTWFASPTLNLSSLTPGTTYIVYAMGTSPQGTPRYVKAQVLYTG